MLFKSAKENRDIQIIDIHSHILPCIDDGSPSIDCSLSLLKTEAEKGVKSVICTPHLRGKFDLPAEKVREVFQDFKGKAQDANIPIDLFLGEELFYDKDLFEKLKTGEALTMADSKYILLEFPFETKVDAVEIVYKFIRSGFVPIIAHVERYEYIDIDMACEMKGYGALIQVNAESILRKEKIVSKLFNENLIDFVASDIHFFRENHIREAFDIVSKKYGDLTAKKVFFENAKEIIK